MRVSAHPAAVQPVNTPPKRGRRPEEDSRPEPKGQKVADIKISEKLASAEVKQLGFYFTDFEGNFQMRTYRKTDSSEKSVREGENFDGSSHPGWQNIFDSDLTIRPANDSEEVAFDNIFAKHPTFNLICNIFDPITNEPYEFDPRHVALRAEQHLKDKLGPEAKSFFGPEAEFYLFDTVRFDQKPNGGFYQLTADQSNWPTESGPTVHNGQYLPEKGGYTPVQPKDSHLNFRSDVAEKLEQVGIESNVHHHEVGGAGQNEIGIELDTLVRSADKQQKFRWVIQNTAKEQGKTVTFMPKPVQGDNGNGMHVHFSIWNEGTNTFAGKTYAGMSDTALHAIRGIFDHAKAMAAFTNPTTNSYKRLVPGFEAPNVLAYSARNRSAAIRIPLVPDQSDKARRFEYRSPDAKANPYLAFSAIQMAALDGLKKGEVPKNGPSDNVDFFELSPKEIGEMGIDILPGTLSEALDALQADHAFLTEGGVFTEDFIQRYIQFKRDEITQVEKLAPTPSEFQKYF